MSCFKIIIDFIGNVHVLIMFSSLFLRQEEIMFNPLITWKGEEFRSAMHIFMYSQGDRIKKSIRQKTEF